MPISYGELVLRLALAVVLAAAVGLERERHERSAGFRTHALVGLGSCLFMLISLLGFEDVIQRPHVALDPSHLAGQVVTGIGFLGAGTIIIQRRSVHGLTTAASVWTVAAIGLAVGGGLYAAALVTTGLTLGILVVLLWAEVHFEKRWSRQVIFAIFNPDQITVAQMVGVVESAGVKIKRIGVESIDRSRDRRVEFSPENVRTENIGTALHELSRLPGVQKSEISERSRPKRG